MLTVYFFRWVNEECRIMKIGEKRYMKQEKYNHIIIKKARVKKFILGINRSVDLKDNSLHEGIQKTKPNLKKSKHKIYSYKYFVKLVTENKLYVRYRIFKFVWRCFKSNYSV